MKYIAVFEVPDYEDVSEGAILMCGLHAYGANVKQAPQQIDFTPGTFRDGYNQCLKDCGAMMESEE